MRIKDYIHMLILLFRTTLLSIYMRTVRYYDSSHALLMCIHR